MLRIRKIVFCELALKYLHLHAKKKKKNQNCPKVAAISETPAITLCSGIQLKINLLTCLNKSVTIFPDLR